MKPESADQPAPSLLSRTFRGDKVLWITALVLAVISVLVVYSSTAKMAYAASTLRTSCATSC